MSSLMNSNFLRYIHDVIADIVGIDEYDDSSSTNRILKYSSRSSNNFTIILFALNYLLILVSVNFGLVRYIRKMAPNPVFYGSLTKEWYDIWRHASVSAGDSAAISATNAAVERPLSISVANDRLTLNEIQLVFHNLGLFPTESQIYEMIQCASRCSGSLTTAQLNQQQHDNRKKEKRNGYSQSNKEQCLTFGEFCYFASILQNNYQQQQSVPSVPNTLNVSDAFYNKLDRIQEFNSSRIDENDDDNNASFEVFLGGSCNPTRWRTEVAIPELKKHGITYYNPQVDHWGPELIELENYAKQNSEILFFVIDNQTRAIASMIEVAFIAGSDRKLILAINDLEWPSCKIGGDKFSDEEFGHMNKGRAYLRDVVERQGIPIFSEVPQALKSAIRVLKEQIRPQDLTHQADNIMPIKMGHISVADKMIKMFKVFESLKNECKEFTFAELALAYRSLTRKELSQKLIQQLALCHNRTVSGASDTESDDCGIDHLDNGNDNDDNNEGSCDCKKNIIANNLDKIVINFDQFCCIITELNHLQDKAAEADAKAKSSKVNKSAMQQHHHQDPLWIRSVKHFPAYLLERIAKFYQLLMSIIDETFSHKESPNLAMSAQNEEYDVINPPQLQSQHSSPLHYGPSYGPAAGVIRRPSYSRRLSSVHNNHSIHSPHHLPPPHQSSSVRYSYQSASSTSSPGQSNHHQLRRHSFSQSRSMVTSGGAVHHHHHHYLSPPSAGTTPSPSPSPVGFNRVSSSGRHHHLSHHHNLRQAESSSSITSLLYDSSNTDLFIGGEVDGKFLSDSIIPLLKKHSITYCTPMHDAWTSQRMIPLQAKKYENCRCLLFIITKDSLDISFMILAAHYVGLGKNVVLCIQYMDPNDPEMLSKISLDAIKDYNRGRSYLSDLATKSGVRVFSDISEAIECSIDICSNYDNGTNWDSMMQ